jgi:hypothetical protein
MIPSNLRTIGCVLLVLGLSLSSCYDEDLSGIDLGYGYFPLELGKYVIYEVDSSWRDDIIGPIGAGHLSYILRDRNESIFLDEEGREAIRVERQRQVAGGWVMKDVWSRVITPTFAEQNEENVIFIKHNFPVIEGKSWDGHARATPLSVQQYYKADNIPFDWSYTYRDLDSPFSINGLQFDSTVTVIQIDRPAAFGITLYSEEVYAKHVGMVYKKLLVYNVQQNASNPAGRDTIGYELEMRAIDFGQ